MTKHIIEARVAGRRVLNATTNEIDLVAPEIAATAVPGQFVNLRVSRHTAPLLRRPFGVARVDREKGTITLMYRILGEATKMLAEVREGETLSVVGPLGYGFCLEAERPLLVGGGLGLAPLLYLAEAFREKAEAGAGRKADVLMGGRTAEDLFWKEIFAPCGEKIGLTTDDGSLGTKGTVMAALPEMLAEGGYDCVYVCGPVPMMRAVSEAVLAAGIRCQVSLEKYMGCGLGACLSCSCGGIGKRLKVCTDGPVFWAEEVGEW